MQISTKAYGKVEINPDEIITFASGLIGFEDRRKFVLLGTSDADEVLVWLQSLEDENLAFVVVQPRFIKPDYQPEIQVEEIRDLEAEDEKELLLLSIVTIPEDVSKMTANLKAPLVINAKKNTGKQIVLNDNRFQIKTPVLAEE